MARARQALFHRQAAAQLDGRRPDRQGAAAGAHPAPRARSDGRVLLEFPRHVRGRVRAHLRSRCARVALPGISPRDGSLACGDARAHSRRRLQRSRQRSRNDDAPRARILRARMGSRLRRPRTQRSRRSRRSAPHRCASRSTRARFRNGDGTRGSWRRCSGRSRRRVGVWWGSAAPFCFRFRADAKTDSRPCVVPSAILAAGSLSLCLPKEK